MHVQVEVRLRNDRVATTIRIRPFPLVRDNPGGPPVNFRSFLHQKQTQKCLLFRHNQINVCIFSMPQNDLGGLF